MTIRSTTQANASGVSGCVNPMNPQVDLLGVRIGEKKRKKGKSLGCLSKKELIAEVRKIFPNATVLPNLEMSSEKTRQAEKRKAL
jgi:ABC-type branched-subunit amino acid transport system ATPase component